VDVDDARREHEAARVDALARGPEVRPHRDDPTLAHRDAARAPAAAQPVDHGRVLDHQVVHGQPR
jgi:hypothetical protein